MNPDAKSTTQEPFKLILWFEELRTYTHAVMFDAACGVNIDLFCILIKAPTGF
jgi:hypothetical protein